MNLSIQPYLLRIVSSVICGSVIIWILTISFKIAEIDSCILPNQLTFNLNYLISAFIFGEFFSSTFEHFFIYKIFFGKYSTDDSRDLFDHVNPRDIWKWKCIGKLILLAFPFLLFFFKNQKNTIIKEHNFYKCINNKNLYPVSELYYNLYRIWSGISGVLFLLIFVFIANIFITEKYLTFFAWTFIYWIIYQLALYFSILNRVIANKRTLLTDSKP